MGRVRRPIRILSLYDGMACGMIAMQKAGVVVDRYVAYEIDKYAIKTSSHNFPMIEQRGNVFSADFTEFEGFDWLIGGSPCTYWSIAQKFNREIEASGIGWDLFCQYVKALREAKPKFFIYENNRSMSNAIKQSISETFGFEPICINSALVSAQTRQRLYWVGKRNEDGTYSKVDVKQPDDKGILLKDILENSIVDKDKAYCLKHQAGNARDYFKKHHTQIKFEPVCTTDDGKSRTIKAQYYKNSVANFISNTGGDFGASACAEPVRIGTYPNNAKNQTHDSQQYRIYDIDAKSVTLCGNGGGMGAKTGLYAIPVEWNQDFRPIKAISVIDEKIYTVYRVENGFITINDKQYPIKLPDGYYIIRKLTVRECMRLQTIPEWYEFPVSDTQAYKMLGNGWTVDVIVHLIMSVLTDWR